MMFGLILYIVISILIGCVICFRGQKLFFPVIRVLACITAFSVIFYWMGVSLKSILIAVVVSVLLMVLLQFFHIAGALLLGGITGAAIGTLISGLLSNFLTGYSWVIVAVCAVAAAVCCAVWRDQLLMLATAYIGASLIAAPLCFVVFQFTSLSSHISADGAISTLEHFNQYLNGPFLVQNALLVLAATVIFTLLGYFAQRKARVE